HRLSRVKVERIQVKGTHMRLVALIGHRSGGVVDLDISVVTRRGLGLTRASHPERQGETTSNHRRTSGDDQLGWLSKRKHTATPLVAALTPKTVHHPKER